MSSYPGGDGFYLSPDVLIKLGNGNPYSGKKTLRALIDMEMSSVPVNGPTERPPNVHAATVADEEAILNLIRVDIAENASHIAPLSEKRILEFVQNATRDHRATIGVIGRVEGLIYLQPEQWFWSEDWFIAERLTVVHPDKRVSRHGSDLLKFAKWFVDEMRSKSGLRVFLLANVVATKESLRKRAMFGRSLNCIGSVFAYPNPTEQPS